MIKPYTLGILFLIIVSLLWTICSMVVQYLYNDYKFNSPFLIVYIGTSLFSVWLPIRYCWERYGLWIVKFRRLYCNSCCIDDEDDESYEVVVIPWKNCNKQRQRQGEAPEELETFNNNSNHNNRFHDDESDRTPNSYEPHIRRTSTSSTNTTNHILSHQEHISMSKTIAPLWFLSNYFYAISLQYTSIASSTVLASMGSIFTFLFATCSKYGDERVTRYKLLGVMLCFCGGVATAWTDVNGGGSSSESTDTTLDTDGNGRIRRVLLPHIITNIEQSESVQSLLGDIAGLLSAIGYGAYTVLIRNVCPKDESRMSMQLFFGYIGILNMIILCPFALWIIVSDNDSQEEEVDSIEQTQGGIDQASTEDNDQITTTLTGTIFLFLILKGSLDNVLSDYLWARAVILTSATVASVGVGLTIPMAFIADYIMGNYNDNDSSGSIEVGDVLGALFVLMGFIFVNMNHELGDRSSRGVSSVLDNEEGYDFGDSDDALDIVSVDRNEAAILS